jgi:TetR/AcrR family transcriptional regulator, tetracycline repressor protein
LNRLRVIEKGLEILDREGPEGLSMRKLAQALGVEAMSLYNHVKGKQDLLDGVANLVLSSVPIPADSKPWRGRVEAIILGLYTALAKHPHTLMLIVSEDAKISEPKALALLDSGAKALASSGLTPAGQVSAYRGLISLCFGFVLAHTRGLTSTRAEAEAIWDQWNPKDYTESGFPSLAKLAPQFLKTRADDDLKFTLAVYLDALEAKARR